MVIRKATNEDINGVFNLILQNIVYHQQFDKDKYKLNDTVYKMLWADIYDNFDNYVVYVITDSTNIKLLGFVRYLINTKTKTLTMCELFISDEHRGKGYGRTLVKSSLREFSKGMTLVLSVHPSNMNAIMFYSNLGLRLSEIKFSKSL